MTEGFNAAGLLQIVVSDIVLSGDNAVVIGLAVANLPLALRRRAILVGTAGAILLRVLFTVISTFLLAVPLLRFAGGATLLWIGWKLMAQTEEDVDEPSEIPAGFADAIRTIIIADAVMSLDNALAVAGAADGNILLLVIGLALSIPLLMIGASFVSNVFKRFPWLVWLASGLIAWVATDLMHEDKLVRQVLPFLESDLALWILRVVCVAGVLLLGLRSRNLKQHSSAEV